MEPAERTAAVEDPVIMPGNMMISMMRIRRTAGTLWNFSMTRLDSASSAPESDDADAASAPQDNADDDEFIDDTPEGLEDDDDELDDDLEEVEVELD